MDQTYREGAEATSPGGLDITVHLTRGETAALGTEASQLINWIHTALMALSTLRTGQMEYAEGPAAPDANWWYWPINDLETKLLPRLRGIRDAVIRRHAGAGGSYGQLGRAMDVSKSTAQRRRDSLMEKAPSFWEDWASAGGPMSNRTDLDVLTAPNHTADDAPAAPNHTDRTAQILALVDEYGQSHRMSQALAGTRTAGAGDQEKARADRTRTEIARLLAELADTPDPH
jgi:hypothetical protein